MIKKNEAIIRRMYRVNKKCKRSDLSLDGYTVLDDRVFFGTLFYFIITYDRGDFEENKSNSRPILIDRYKEFLDKCLEDNDVEVPINMENLRTFCKDVKTDEVACVICDNPKIGVNGRYLLDLLTFCKTDKVLISTKGNPAINPIFVTGNYGTAGVVLPMRVKED